MKESTRKRFESIKRKLKGKRVLVAFSGGVDSTVLGSIVKDVASKTILLTISSPTVPKIELDDARRIAEELELELIIKEFNWLAEEQLTKNQTDRCFRCKQILSTIWITTANELGLDLVVEGTTASEVEGYRPGTKALEDSGVLSPFLSAGITKEEIRQYARERGLSVAEKPSMACLATRFPYGIEISKNLLKMVEVVESAVKSIFAVECVRARYHGNLVRIEVAPTELPSMFDSHKLKILEKIAKDAGFMYVTLDIGGYRTGSMDKSINL